MTTNELYWAAGFIEGEGCFLYPPGGTQIVEVRQVQKEPLERLAHIFNTHGSVISGKRDSRIWRWTISGCKARGIMMTLYLLMSPKRQNKIREILQAWKKAPGSGAWKRKKEI